MTKRFLAFTKVSTVIFYLLLSGSARSANLCVDDDNATGVEDGAPRNPYNTIQEAIDAAAISGDTIKVAAGIYSENIRVEDKAIQLLGGYAGGAAAGYAGGAGGDFTDRDPTTNTSHIQGVGTDAAVNLVNPGAGTLDGFRITGGTGNFDGSFYRGGGVFCYGGSQTISNNIIEDNDLRHTTPDAGFLGGGIFVEEPWDGPSNVTIVGNIIRNNVGGRGGGVTILGGAVIMRDNTIQGNIGVDDHGGGLYIVSPSARISRNLILENEVGRDIGYGWGGGLIVVDVISSATLSGNIIRNNYSPTGGAGVFIDEGARAVLDHELVYDNECLEGGGVGVYVDGAGDGAPGDPGSNATLNHCTIANNNAASLDGHGLSVEGNSAVTVGNCIFWGNDGDDFIVDASSSLTVAYTNSEESVSGTGNQSAPPLFANPAAGDFHLMSTGGRWDPTANGGGGFVVDAQHSPCIDAGDSAAPYANESNPNGSRVNLGVYGNTAQASRSDSEEFAGALHWFMY